MGSPEQLARTAAHEFRRRTYAGRHPLVTFIAAPLPTAALLLVGLGAGFLFVLNMAPESSSADEPLRSEEHTSELQSPCNLVCRRYSSLFPYTTLFRSEWDRLSSSLVQPRTSFGGEHTPADTRWSRLSRRRCPRRHCY